MASCTYNPGVSGSNPYAVLNVTQQSQNVSANTSVVRWELLIYRPSPISSSAPKAYSIVVNGATVANTTTTIGGSGTKSIASGTTTISHAADGTKSISFSFSLEIAITWGSTWIGTGSASGSMSLSTIPRASSISISPTSVSLGSNIAVTITRASTAFTHTLQHDFLAGSWTTFASGATTSGTLTTALSWATKIPNATSGSGRIRCITCNGSTYIGETIANFTATVPASVVPTISAISVAETVSGLNAQFAGYVQGKSIPKVTISAAGAQGSTISTYSTVIGSSSYTGSSFTGSLLNTAGTVTITTTVTDSRGRTSSKSASITVLAYSPPTISAFSVVRCNSAGSETTSGNYVKIVATGTIASCNNKNGSSYKIEYKLSSASTWTSLITGTGYSISLNQAKTITNGFLTTSSYDFRITVSDYFTSAVATKAISTAFTLMNFRSTGKGLGIGKVSEKDALEVAIPAEFASTLSVKGLELSTIFLAQAGEPTTQSVGGVWFRQY